MESQLKYIQQTVVIADSVSVVVSVPAKLGGSEFLGLLFSRIAI
jgi:hypothetical protein